MPSLLLESLLIWRDVASWLWQTLLYLLCGHGERPERAVLWIITMFAGLALVYLAGSGLSDATLGECIYFSGVSITALGYGPWVSTDPAAWARALGVFQSFAGIFLMALFVATLTRKMTR